MSKAALQNKELPRMMRNSNILLLYQTSVAFLGLVLASIGLVTIGILFDLQESRDRRRPGINLKEL
jgi:hypothetical protein